MVALAIAGAPVTVEGLAGNGKAGAIVQATNGEPVYVDGLDAWPKDLEGKRVTATGTLRREKKIPDPGPAAGGELRQGAEGEQPVLHDARYGLARDDWRTATGAVVTVRGTASDPKNGAAVITPSGPCYVKGLSHWPKALAGKPVSVTGRLTRQPGAPPGAAGIPDEWFRLEDARWSSP